MTDLGAAGGGFGNIPGSTLARYIKFAGSVVALLFISTVIGAWFYGAESIVAKLVLPNAVTAGAIFGSALWASWFALQAIETQRLGAGRTADAAKAAAKTQQEEARKTAKLQETLDLILRTELDAEFIKAKQRWASRNRSQQDGADTTISALLAKVHYNANTKPEDFQDAVLIRMFFNNFEAIALAIRNDIIDGDFYKSWQRSSFIDTWNSASEAIGAIRTLSNNPRLYIEWQQLVEIWKDDEPKRSLTVPREYKTNELVRMAGLVKPEQLPPPS